MAITQPGDTTVISPLSVPADAGPAMRAESVQGGFVAIPSGSGPPTSTNLPLVMRRVGELAYTPTDNKFWQLIGGTADANWVEKTFPSGNVRFGATFYVDPAFVGTSNGTQSAPYASITAAIAAAPSTGALFILAPYCNTTESVTFPTTGFWEIRCESEVAATITGNITCSGAAGVVTLTNVLVTGTVSGVATGARFFFAINTDISGAVSLTKTGSGSWALSANSVGAAVLAGTNGRFLSTVAVSGSVLGNCYLFTGALSFTSASELIGCSLATGSIGIGGSLLIVDGTFAAATTFTGSAVVKIDGYSHASAAAAGGITLAGGATITLLNDVNPSGIQQGGASTGQTLVWSGTAWVPSVFTPVNQSDWYVNASTGNDANAGTIGSPLASLDELRKRLNPGGATIYVTQNTVVHVAAGTYNSLELSISIPVGSGFTFDVTCDYTSSSYITLSSVTNTVASASPTRGEITTASGTFVNKARIRSTSGASIGAITYCTGLNGGPTDAFVKSWFNEASSTAVNIANGTTVVVDTLGVTINRIQIRTPGHPLGGAITIRDAILPNGAELLNTIGGSSSLVLSQCRIGSSSISRLSGNVQLRNCQISGSGLLSIFGLVVPVFLGCVIENQIQVVSTAQLFIANCVNGGSFIVGGITVLIQSSLFLADTEWVNGSNTAVSISSGSLVQIGGQQFGFGSSYAVGYAQAGGSNVVTDTVAHASGILATQQVTMSGQNVNYSDLPRVYPRAQCAFTLITDATAPALVQSAFGRTGAVVAAAGDYGSTLITNNSSVSGTTVTDALNTLLVGIGGGGAVSSVFTRTGAITAALNDYSSSLIQNLSSVTSGGTTVTTALNSLQSQQTSTATTVAGLTTGVSSVFGRTNAVNAASGDYNSTQITNGSSVAGGNVTVALNNIQSALSTAGPIVSVFGRTGAVASATNDYNSSQIFNSSGVTGGGSSVTTSLNSLQTQVSSLVPSVFGRTGPISAVSGDYSSTQITNSSSVIGSTVTAALNQLISAYPGGVITFNTPGTYGFSTSFLGRLVELGSSGTYTFNVPTFASAGIPVGMELTVLQYAPGSKLALSFASGTTVLNSVHLTSDLFTRYVLTHVATDVWTVDTITNFTSDEIRHYPILNGFPHTYWSFTPGIGLLSTGSGGSGSYYVPIGPFTDNESISSIRATFVAGPGHGSMPSSGNKPVIKLWAQSTTGSLAPALASASDPSSTIPVYEATHTWSAIVSPAVSCANTHFWAEFIDETGIGGTLYGISATISRT